MMPNPATHQTQPPLDVALLGYGGLVPFITLTLFSVLHTGDADLYEKSTLALRSYGVVILSFVGALHWGFAMFTADLAPAPRRLAYVWSVVPALLA